LSWGGGVGALYGRAFSSGGQEKVLGGRQDGGRRWNGRFIRPLAPPPRQGRQNYRSRSLATFLAPLQGAVVLTSCDRWFQPPGGGPSPPAAILPPLRGSGGCVPVAGPRTADSDRVGFRRRCLAALLRLVCDTVALLSVFSIPLSSNRPPARWGVVQRTGMCDRPTSSAYRPEISPARPPRSGDAR